MSDPIKLDASQVSHGREPISVPEGYERVLVETPVIHDRTFIRREWITRKLKAVKPIELKHALPNKKV